MSLLRGATAEVHARLERALPLMRPDLTLNRYVRCLDTFYAAYASHEALLDGAVRRHRLAGRLAWEQRRKVPWLEADRAALSIAWSRPIAPLPPLPAADSVPQVMGALYVMEGATLGGRVIACHLRRVLGLTAAQGAAFFSGYGERTGAMWRAFCHDVEDAVCGPSAQGEAVAAAHATFERLELALVAGGVGLEHAH